jgi:hypothetical protein
MAALIHPSSDRRGERRHSSEHTGWKAEAVLRPGLLVRILNINSRGVLVQSPGRLRPGRTVELQLAELDGDRRPVVAGRVGRCRVAHLDPLLFHGVVVFDRPLDIQSRNE